MLAGVKAPGAPTLNDLLYVCHEFATQHFIIFTTKKIVCMYIAPKTSWLTVLPSMLWNGTKLPNVEFSYLSLVICGELSVDEDIRIQTRKLCARDDMLIREIEFCNPELRCSFFRAYCYHIKNKPIGKLAKVLDVGVMWLFN